MNIYRISAKIREMYEAEVNADIGTWRDVLSSFDKAVEECSDVDILVKCLLEDDLWYIPFDSRMKLMEKAKSLGGWVTLPNLRHLTNRIKLRGSVSVSA